MKSRRGIRQAVVALLALLLITTEGMALAQFGGFELPLGGVGGEGQTTDDDSGEGEPQESNPACPNMDDLAKMVPEARKVAGIAMQAGNSTFIMMTRGREILGESMEETGDTTQALRVIRDEAAFMALECSSDQYYRSGVCQDFTLQCLAHGGGGCDSCGRRWGNLFCKENLKKIKESVPNLDEIFGEDTEWGELVSLADQVPGSTLIQDLDKFKDDAVSAAVDGPVDELCDGFFYGVS